MEYVPEEAEGEPTRTSWLRSARQHPGQRVVAGQQGSTPRKRAQNDAARSGIRLSNAYPCIHYLSPALRTSDFLEKCQPSLALLTVEASGIAVAAPRQVMVKFLDAASGPSQK